MRKQALDEIRVAKFLEGKGFPPIAGTWKPNGSSSAGGEFTVQGQSGSAVLVEVKRRSWQSEVPKEEKPPRLTQAEFSRPAAGPISAAASIRAAIDEAYPKFTDETASLLVIYGEDFEFPRPDRAEESARRALYLSLPNDRGYFADSRYENLGGLAVFWTDSTGETPVRYEMKLFVNAFALPATRLPREFLDAFKGVRLWDDPAEPDHALKAKRLGDPDRLDRDRILHVLERKRDALRRRGARSLSLFGSAARGENDAASDLDFVVDLDPKTFAGYMGLKEYLEDLFGCRVDLALSDAIKPVCAKAYSASASMPRNFRLYLQDILDACRKIREYTVGQDFGSFKSDSKTIDAVLRNLEIIGEAVKNVPEEVRNRSPQIARKNIAGLRTILAHAYFAVDATIVWDIIQNECRG